MIQEQGYPAERLRWLIKDWSDVNRHPQRPNIEHCQGVGNFHGSLDLALRDLPNTELIVWLQGRVLEMEFQSGNENLKIEPDGFFIVKSGDRIITGFHEFVRMIDPKRHISKLRAYWQLWAEGDGHVRLAKRLREALSRTGELSAIEARMGKKFSIDSFQVWNVMSTEARMQSIRRMALNADPEHKGSPMFQFTFDTCGVCDICLRRNRCDICVGYGRRCEQCKAVRRCPRGFDISEPSTILGSIWQSPLDNHFYRLLR